MSDNEIVLDLEKAKSVKIPTGKKGITLRVVGNFFNVAICLHFDASDEFQKDESVTLKATDGSYTKTVKIEEGLEVDGGRKLVFERVLPEKTYEMIVSAGGGETYFLFRDLTASKDLLKQCAHK